MKALHLAALVVAGGVFATSMVYAGKSVVWLTRDREQASVHGEIGRDLHGVVVSAAVSGSQLDLGTLNRTLVFVFDTSCTACDANMANWISVLAKLQQDDVQAIALGMGEGTLLQGYWRPLLHRIPVFVVDSSGIVQARLRGTPTTILVHGGRVAAEYIGVLTRPERSRLAAAAREALTASGTEPFNAQTGSR